MNTHIIKTLLVSHGKIQTSLQLLVWPVLLAPVLPHTFNGRLASLTTSSTGFSFQNLAF
jgi:hypothetical protein